MTLIALGEDTEGKERERNGKRGQGAAKRKKRLMKGVQKLHTQISVHTCTCKWGRKDEQKFLSEDFQNHKNREVSRSPRTFFFLTQLTQLVTADCLAGLSMGASESQSHHSGWALWNQLQGPGHLATAFSRFSTGCFGWQIKQNCYTLTVSYSTIVITIWDFYEFVASNSRSFDLWPGRVERWCYFCDYAQHEQGWANVRLIWSLTPLFLHLADSGMNVCTRLWPSCVSFCKALRRSVATRAHICTSGWYWMAILMQRGLSRWTLSWTTTRRLPP